MTLYDAPGVLYDDLGILYDGAEISRLHDVPTYRVQVFAFADSSTFGIGPLIAEFELAKFIGWADYLNDVPEAFFTVNQDDPKMALVLQHVGRAHVRILRSDEVVFAGWLLDSDETLEDVIFYCWGYLAGLFWYLTDWNQTWANKTVQDIVRDLWDRAKTTLTKSLLGFVETGFIEAPVTTTGGHVPITLGTFRGFYSIILFMLRELASLGTSNTGNTVVFEITHSTTPTFNFLKDKGVQRPNALLEYGGNVSAFRRRRSSVFRRNDIFGVGSAPHDVVMRDNESDSADFDTWGRRQGPVFFSWVRDETELDRATKRRLVLAKRQDVDLALTVKPNAIVPPGANGSPMRLGDEVPVRIEKGLTQIDGEFFQVVGHQTVAMRGVEVVHLMLQEPAA